MSSRAFRRAVEKRLQQSTLDDSSLNEEDSYSSDSDSCVDLLNATSSNPFDLVWMLTIWDGCSIDRFCQLNTEDLSIPDCSVDWKAECNVSATGVALESFPNASRASARKESGRAKQQPSSLEDDLHAILKEFGETTPRESHIVNASPRGNSNPIQWPIESRFLNKNYEMKRKFGVHVVWRPRIFFGQ